ncbi:MAG: outer membrane protein assembly factor BamA [Bdellovibrio sp.]|nr:outer membrane protein assembly factor BamA [Bdellovibrio sp.]
MCVNPDGQAQQQATPPRPPSKPAAEPARSAPTGRSIEDSEKLTPPVTTVAPVAKGTRITAIEITGQKKIEKEAILAKLISQVGGGFSEKQVSQDIEVLYKMGFFVQIEVAKETSSQGVRLEYRIIEKPTVSEITFEGNNDQKTEDLEGQITIKAFEILNNAKIKESVTKLEKFYEEKGFYLVKITTAIEDVKKDETARIKFIITENEKVKVKKITFLGNAKLKDSFLKGRLFTQEAGFFSAMSNSGSFKQDAFERDIQILKYMYWNLGYVQVKIDRPLVTVTPDKKSIYITYHIEEGEQYSVGEVDFSGDLLFSKSELMNDIKIKDNGIFAVDVMQKDIADLQAKYGDLGYAFANVIPRYAFHEKEKKVDLVFEFEKGQKVYFGTINVVGNTKTRDKVVRREMKIREGELYHETRKRQSQENIQRLGFFDEVNFKTSTPPEIPNQLNIEIVVKERNTGQLQLTAGYGSVQGLSLGGSIQQNNFRGLGQSLGARIDATRNRQDYSISLTEPYLNDTLWSSGFEVFYIENKERINYDNRKTGGSLRFGHPVWGDNLRAFLRYKLDKTELFANDNTDPFLFPLDTARGVTSSGTATLEYDTRNDRFTPSKGIYADVSYERTGIGGGLKYQEFSSRLRYFHNIFWDVVWRNNLTYLNLQPLGGDDVPFTERYQLGGAYNLRGYGSSTVGRRLFSNFRYNKIGTNDGNPFYTPGISDEERRRRSNLIFGGTTEVLFQTELQFPLIKEAGLTGVFFYDVGQADDIVVDKNFLSDFGIGFRWQSPLGLLRFEWGWPLSRDNIERDAVNFEFSIGPPF